MSKVPLRFSSFGDRAIITVDGSKGKAMQLVINSFLRIVRTSLAQEKEKERGLDRVDWLIDRRRLSAGSKPSID